MRTDVIYRTSYLWIISKNFIRPKTTMRFIFYIIYQVFYMDHYFLKIIWYNFDLRVICELYCSSVDKSLTLMKGKRKIGSKYMQLKYDVFSQTRGTIFKRSFAQTYVYVTLSMFYLLKRHHNGAVVQSRAICVYPHSLTSEAVTSRRSYYLTQVR